MRKRTIFVSVICLLAAVSCSKEPVTRESGEGDGLAVSFGVLEDCGVRAAGETDDIAVNGYSIGVFAYDTGVYPYSDCNLHPNFMYNQEVVYGDDGRWGYWPVKYWPNGNGNVDGVTGEWEEMLTFFAYAPYSNTDADGGNNDAGYCIPTISSPFEAGNPWIIYRIHEDVSRQVDLLYAMPVLDKTKPGVNDLVRFRFRHALACVGEQVRINCGSSLEGELEKYVNENGGSARVVLNEVSVRYTLTERAKLSLWTPNLVSGAGLPTWMPALNGQPTTDRTVVYGSDLDHVLYSTDGSGDPGLWTSPENMGVFYIPLDIYDHPQTATIRVKYTVVRSNGAALETEHTKESSFRLSSFPEAFAPGKKLSNLSLTIN